MEIRNQSTKMVSFFGSTTKVKTEGESQDQVDGGQARMAWVSKSSAYSVGCPKG